MRLAATVAVTLLAAAGAKASTFLSIGSGDIAGAYFAAARAICEAVNRADRAGLRCSPEMTQGSVYNLISLGRGDLDFAIVQSDWQRRAVEGDGMFAGRPMTDLRAVMSLHAEQFTALARRELGVLRLPDLRGRRIDIGHPSSGRRAVAEHVLRGYGLGPGDFAEVFELQGGAALTELCARRIDATLLIIGHPNDAVARALADCDLTILPVDGLAAGADRSPLYDEMTIAAGLYPALPAPIRTFGVYATVVARADTPDAVVETLVRETMANLPRLARRSPVLTGLDPASMHTRGLSAPLHPAAERAFAAFGSGL